jgi:diguanylate cyclase (GGDEF)-like protein/PAS domain S-box-containing protein
MTFFLQNSGFLLGTLLALALLTLALGLLLFHTRLSLLAARHGEHNFRELYNSISEGAFRCTMDGLIFQANPAAWRLHGFSSEADMIGNASALSLGWYVDPERRKEVGRRLKETGRVVGLISEVQRFRTRERIWVEENIRVVKDAAGLPRHIQGTVRDVTDAIRRIELQERTEKIASLVSGCLYQQRTYADGRFAVPYVSIGITALLGVTPEEAQNDPGVLFSLVHPEDRQALVDSFVQSARTLAPRHFEYRVILRDGTEKWVRGQSVPEPQADGAVLWHGFLSDVTESKVAVERVYDLAYLDALTQLPNRTALVERLKAALEAPRQSANWSALLFIDLDQFKVLNDTKGHHVGDRLLHDVAERLRPLCENNDFVARLGGDEFVIVVRDLAPVREIAEQQVTRVVERVHETIARPFVLDGFPFRTSASIGVALFRGKETHVDDLLKRADMAMYEAKASGRGASSFFVAEMQEMLEERLGLTMELREALEAGELMLHYQPQVDDAGVPFGVEALLRWDHPKRGQIPPAVFIPLAERGGFAELIDAYVLSRACETLTRWAKDATLRDIQMAVNVGGRHVGQDLVDLVTDTLAITGADVSHLSIELTERVMLDDVVEVEAALTALKKLGLRVVLDDFGTGYSSLSHLKRLPIDALKIDCSFVRDIETDQNDRVIVQTILNIARNLGLSAIAEGVENDMQAMLLRRFGCRAFQGFLHGRPMPLEEVEQRLASMMDRSRVAVMPPSRLVV